jgi:sporulation protein YlmC with PRC-barrel domain
MRLTDLRGARVKSVDGQTLGRVHEVQAEGGKIVALRCGAASLLERMTSRSHGRRIPWESVRTIARGEIVVTSEASEKKPSGPRSPQGTRRPSAPRSKR